MTFLSKKKAYVENILVWKNYFEHKRFLKEKRAHGFYFQKKKFEFQKSHEFEEKKIFVLKLCLHSKDFLHHILGKKKKFPTW